MKREELNAETWETCDELQVFGLFHVDASFANAPPSDRKCRLFGVAVAQRVLPYIADERLRTVVDAMECHADFPDEQRRSALEEPARVAYAEACGEGYVFLHHPDHRAEILARAPYHLLARDMNFFQAGDRTYPQSKWERLASGLEHELVPGRTIAEAKTLHLALFHDIFPNPFRPVAFDPAWRTSTTVGLASAMYESRSFANMPILADALEEAGCDHAGVLAHCRDEAGVHVRGCWVVDLVLGKS